MMKEFRIDPKELAELKIADEDAMYYDQSVTGDTLLHGACDIFSDCMVSVLKNRGYSVESVRDIWPKEKYNFSYPHQYCVVYGENGTVRYVDAHGVFEDYESFMQEFVDYETNNMGRDLDLSELDHVAIYKLEDTSEQVDAGLWMDYDESDAYEKAALSLSRKLIDKHIDEFMNVLGEPVQISAMKEDAIPSVKMNGAPDIPDDEVADGFPDLQKDDVFNDIAE